MPSFKPVTALARGLDVLRVVNEQGQATIRSLHKSTGLDKATIVRMLETLEHMGYVVRAEDDAVYAPTGRTLLLSQGYDHHLAVGRAAEPVLGEFRKQIGWPSDVAVFDQDALVIVRTSRGGLGPISFNRRPGFRAPVLVTAIGRAYLAFCPPDEYAALVGLLAARPGPWNDLARDPLALESLLAGIRAQGFSVIDEAYSHQEYGGLVWALAVPVIEGGQIFGAMNVMMLKSAVTLDEARAKYLEPLRQAAARLAGALARKAGGVAE